ncbi:SpvB/TcaC N-terminal domain-containing protein [Streptosporangium sp. NPDC005286]|uniref:SpvB/TcaC N-terminal domain-containing protein n=1 Tax=Streptosporangium sp. NPDC005286 TaxID=3154463 RepID=UPI0033AAE4CA
MSDAAHAPTQIISLPQGGGAVKGLGEKFSPDPHTGTGNFAVPLAVPAGRNGFEPKLDLAYSTGAGNGWFGLGWGLSVPGVCRRTSRGVPVYDDDRDTFILSGVEDLVPVERVPGGPDRYRPRTEGLFARIEHHAADGSDFWEVAGKDGMVSRYGTARPPSAPPDWRDPAAVMDGPRRIFAWKLTRTRDPFGNLIEYDYVQDEGEGDGHRWNQPLLRRIRYADYDDAGRTAFLCAVTFDYEDRPDPFSDYQAGFEIRTTLRCRSITAAVRPGRDLPVRRYEFAYEADPGNGVSLLRSLAVAGFDDSGAERRDLPPLRFGYTRFAPEGRGFEPVRGPDLPPVSLTRGDHELADVTGDGLPDIVELNGTARYWRNLGGGVFDRPRTMGSAPAGLRLSDPGVRLLDADGDGRADLLVTAPGQAGYFPLRFDATWGPYRPYATAPTFSLEDPQVRLADLDGDGVTDALRSDGRLECFFNDPERGWTGPVRAPSDLPLIDFADPRVRLARMTGGGLQDLVLIHSGDISYWPNLGHGRWGPRLRMRDSPRPSYRFDPRRLLLGDVDGDGLADLVYVGDDEVTVWINRSGNGWSDPFVVKGTPAPGDADDLRIVDLLGTGAAGVLWSRDAGRRRPPMFFLDLTGGVKPRLLAEMDNDIGAITRVTYAPSSRFALADSARAATRWRTTLPIVVPVVAGVEVIDTVSRGRLTTEYRYHQGHWDSREREFRGFACVEQLDTQSFAGYDGVVDRVAFSPPTLTRTWFHVGPIGDEDWSEPDWSFGYWAGDPNLLRHTEGVERFLRTLPGRRSRRDAIRALRGSVLRAELYALDDTERRHRPYTVTETAYELREEAARVYFPFTVAQRTTQWERGDDPMTHVGYTRDYDAFGQPRSQTSIALPRRSARRRPVTAVVVGKFDPDETHILATQSRTSYAFGVTVHDRVAQTWTYELVAPPTVMESAPADVRAVLRDQLSAARAAQQLFHHAANIHLIGHIRHHYDGAAFAGLPVGQAGQFGVLSRSEVLVFTGELLDRAYGEARPAYLGGPAPLPQGAPSGFGTALGFHAETDGFYADTLRQRYDFQTPGRPPHGLVIGVQDPLGNETEIELDEFSLFPAKVRDPAGLETSAEYDYRFGGVRRVTDPNGHSTVYRFHPLGLPSRVFLRGREGEGGTDATPEIAYSYDFLTLPVRVRTARRVHHGMDEVVETREYSDGFGRLVQRRVQADELGFDDVLGGGSAMGTRVPDRVVVSGWKTYDNKGQVVEKYEPFFDRGWDFQPEEDARRGCRVSLSYDPRGRMVKAVYPDGSQTRTTFGRPGDAEPTPWVLTSHDQNDLAPLSPGAGRVPVDHHDTPETVIIDALGRTRCTLARAGAEVHATRTSYDVRGNVLKVTDQLGRTAFRYDYDLLNRALRVTGLDTGTMTTVSDAAGTVVETRDSRGCVSLREYDALNRPIRLWARDVPTDPVSLRQKVEYGDAAPDAAAARSKNRLGRVWRHYDEAGLLTFDAYDFKGNVTRKTRRTIRDSALAAGWRANWAAGNASAALESDDYPVTTAYDALNRVIRLRTPAGPDGRRTELTPHYGRSGALQAVELDGTPYIRLIAYNPRGQRVLITYGNQTMTRYAYDPATFRLARMRSERFTTSGNTWTGTGTPLQDLTYEWDLVGNVISIEERVPGCGVAAPGLSRDRLLRTFGYDALYRLVSATGRECATIPQPRPFADAPRCRTADQAQAYTETYVYDPAGNMSWFRHVGGGRTWYRRFHLDREGNRLTSVENGAGSRRLTYDDVGNLDTEGGIRVHTWDHAGRLVRFAQPSTTARYLYGADGVRVKKWTRRGPATDESTVYIDGVFERHRWTRGGGGEHALIHVLDGAARIALVRRGQAHPGDRGPGIRFTLADHLGSATITTDEAGRWTNREEYFPYGETGFGGFARKRYRFSAQERDLESGLVSHNARSYAPAFCRWISCDPIGLQGGLNGYTSFRNNPLRWVDPGGTLDTDISGTPPTDVAEPAQPQEFFYGPVAGTLAGPRPSSEAAEPSGPDTAAGRGVMSRGGATLLGGGLSLAVGTLMLLGPVGWIAGLTAALLIGGGTAAVGLGAGQLALSYTGNTTEAQDRQLNSAGGVLLGTTSITGYAGVLTGGLATRSMEGMEYGGMIGGMAEGGFSLVRGVGGVVAAEARFMLLRAGSTSHKWANVRPSIQTALGYGDAASRARANPLFWNDVERIELSHFFAQRNILGWESLFNRPWNIKAMWATDHALVDPFRFQFTSSLFKAAYIGEQLQGTARLLQLAPEWMVRVAYGAATSSSAALRHQNTGQ